MAGRYGPNIITDNLKLYVDAGNKESYPQTGTTWTDLSGEGNDGTISGATFSSENTKNSVSGGTITNDGEYIIHTFTNDSASENFITDVALTADVLIVGGGGSGGFALGGGGGGGGVVHLRGLSVAAGTYSMVVGAGGTGGSSDSNGSNSAAFSSTAYGGGSGDGYPNMAGKSGGSGGGAGSVSGNPGGTVSSPAPDGGAATKGALGGNPGTTYGNKGGGQTGPRTGDPTSARGGGGAGAAGADEAPATTDGGDGGAGIQINIDGNNYYWAAGGGGAAYATYAGGNGGLGGGGGGSTNAGGAIEGDGGTGGINDGADSTSNPGGAGGANTGSGGGGGNWSTGNGGAGGSGIVIVRYHRSFAPRRFYFGLDGTGDEVNFGNIILVTSASSTFEAWARPATGIADYDILINKENTYELAWYGAGANPSGGLIAALHNGSTWNWVAGTGANTFNIGEWAHVAVTWTGTTIFTYVNGVQKASASWSGTVYNVTSDPLYIGRRSHSSPSYHWVGDIDQVRIHDRRLMSAEILQNYNAHKGRYGL